jgi:hypothetical protein
MQQNAIACFILNNNFPKLDKHEKITTHYFLYYNGVFR